MGELVRKMAFNDGSILTKTLLVLIFNSAQHTENWMLEESE